MSYGVTLTPSVAGIAMLPATGSNSGLFRFAISLIVLGVVVYAATLIVTQKMRNSDTTN